MIPLSIPDGFVLALLIHMALIFCIAAYYAVRRYRRSPRHRDTPFVFRCSGCGHVYIDRRNVPMAECAKCGTMNENVKSF